MKTLFETLVILPIIWHDIVSLIRNLLLIMRNKSYVKQSGRI